MFAGGFVHGRSATGPRYRIHLKRSLHQRRGPFWNRFLHREDVHVGDFLFCSRTQPHPSYARAVINGACRDRADRDLLPATPQAGFGQGWIPLRRHSKPGVQPLPILNLLLEYAMSGARRYLIMWKRTAFRLQSPIKAVAMFQNGAGVPGPQKWPLRGTACLSHTNTSHKGFALRSLGKNT